MKKTLFLILLVIIFFSGCVENFNVFESKISENAIITKSDDVKLEVQITPRNILSQRTATLEYTIQNLRDDINLTDIKINFYDLCGLSIKEGSAVTNIDSLKPNQTKYYKIKLEAPKIDFNTQCEIKYRLTYNSSTYLTQDIVVLSDSEYAARETAGTLNDISISSKSPKSPILINFKISEAQPLRETKEGENVYIYFSFSNIGNGYIDKIDVGSVTISIPNNLKGYCRNFDNNKNIINLNFYNKETRQITCSFSTKSTQPIDIKQFKISVDNFKYTLDNTININLIKR
ncbi:MAG: hypothetical protein QXO19_00950 [Candidatus Aenigmatarchaeota archaeon]